MKPRTKQQKQDFIRAVLAGNQKTIRMFLDLKPECFEFRQGKIFIMKPNEREITKEGFLRLYNPEHDICFFDSHEEYENFKSRFTGIGLDVSATYNPAGTMEEIRRIVFYE